MFKSLAVDHVYTIQECKDELGTRAMYFFFFRLADFTPCKSVPIDNVCIELLNFVFLDDTLDIEITNSKRLTHSSLDELGGLTVQPKILQLLLKLGQLALQFSGVACQNCA